MKKQAAKAVKRKASPKPRKKTAKKTPAGGKKAVYKDKRITAAGILTAVFFIIASAALVSGGQKGEIILAVDSSACRCIKARCERVERQVKDMLETEKISGLVKLSIYDKAKDKKTEEIMDKYEMGLIPHIVFIDKKGDAIYSANAFRFRLNDFRGTIITAVKGE
ncbi:MAG: hypothetical protein ACLFP1_06750 [Candidatus Goldiibacteriota bacterium]